MTQLQDQDYVLNQGNTSDRVRGSATLWLCGISAVPLATSSNIVKLSTAKGFKTSLIIQTNKPGSMKTTQALCTITV